MQTLPHPVPVAWRRIVMLAGDEVCPGCGHALRRHSVDPVLWDVKCNEVLLGDRVYAHCKCRLRFLPEAAAAALRAADVADAMLVD